MLWRACTKMEGNLKRKSLTADTARAAAWCVAHSLPLRRSRRRWLLAQPGLHNSGGAEPLRLLLVHGLLLLLAPRLFWLQRKHLADVLRSVEGGGGVRNKEKGAVRT